MFSPHTAQIQPIWAPYGQHLGSIWASSGLPIWVPAVPLFHRPDCAQIAYPTKSLPRCSPYLARVLPTYSPDAAHMGPIWAASGLYLGYIWAAHMGPGCSPVSSPRLCPNSISHQEFAQMQPISSPCSPHIQPRCSPYGPHMGSIWALSGLYLNCPYGSRLFPCFIAQIVPN